jgi:hypothetical protein
VLLVLIEILTTPKNLIFCSWTTPAPPCFYLRMNLLWPYKRLTIYYSKHHQGTYKYHFNFPRCQHCFPTRSSICSLLPQERGSQSVSSKLEMGLAMAVSHIGTRLGYCAGILSVVCHLPSMTKYFSHLADKVTNDRQTDRQTSIYLSVCLSIAHVISARPPPTLQPPNQESRRG